MPITKSNRMKWSDPTLIEISQRANLGQCNTGTTVAGLPWCETVGSGDSTACQPTGLSAGACGGGSPS